VDVGEAAARGQGTARDFFEWPFDLRLGFRTQLALVRLTALWGDAARLEAGAARLPATMSAVKKPANCLDILVPLQLVSP
jgi:hypothetical protein